MCKLNYEILQLSLVALLIALVLILAGFNSKWMLPEPNLPPDYPNGVATTSLPEYPFDPTADADTQVTQIAIQCIKAHEPCEGHPFQHLDQVTIGWNCTRQNHPELFQAKLPYLSAEDADLILFSDVLQLLDQVNTVITVPLNIHQKAALISLIHSIGYMNFVHSEIMNQLNRKHYSAAADAFLQWNRVLPPSPSSKDSATHAQLYFTSDRLTRRRTAERELFLRPVNSTSSKAKVKWKLW